MIHLFDQFYLDADDRQFILLEWDGSLSSKENKDCTFSRAYKLQQYFATFKCALEKLTVIMQRRAVANNTDWQELGKKLDEIKESIEELTRRMWPTIEDARGGGREPVGDVPD